MGGRFCSLDQPHSQLYFGPEIFVQLFPDFDWRLKNGLYQNLKGLCPQIRLKTKEEEENKSLHPQFGTIFGRVLRFIGANSRFSTFSSNHPDAYS